MPGVQRQTRTYRSYTATLAGDYTDIRGSEAGLHASDSYSTGQAFGERLRASGEDGVLYDSDRHRGGTNVCAYRPSKVLDVLQAEHFEITVAVAERRIDARRLP